MDKNECAFLIEKGQLYNCMTILVIVSMRLQSRYIDTRLDSPILLSLVWPDRGSNPRLSALEASTLTDAEMDTYCHIQIYEQDVMLRLFFIQCVLSLQTRNHQMYYTGSKVIIYIYVCARFVDIIICVLLVRRGQYISCDNFLSILIAVLFAIK
jgi:hypothetical protein